MKKGKFRRAFTLVELVVVIAVVAILSAVAVGAYFGVINSANESNFDVALAECNKILQANEILDGKNKTLSEVRLDLIENGFDFDNFEFELNDSFFVWDSTTDRFDIKKKTSERSLDQFVVISSDDELETYKRYSYYLTSDYNAIISINWLAGIDAGQANIPDLKDSNGNITTYGINISSNIEWKEGSNPIILNGNGSTSFYVNAPNAEFNEYGTVSGMMVTCAKSSLHLFGSSYGNLIIKGQGRVVFEEGSNFIGTVYAIADTSSGSSGGTDITVEYNGGNYPTEIIKNDESKVEVKGFTEDTVSTNTKVSAEYDASNITKEQTKTDSSKNNVVGDYSFYYTDGNTLSEEITTKEGLTETLKNKSSGYLFASGILDFDLNIPSGVTLVVDYLEESENIKDTIVNINDDDSFEWVTSMTETNKAKRIGEGGNNLIGTNYNFSSSFGTRLTTFTINSQVTLTLSDEANLVVEGKILEPNTSGKIKFEIGDYAEIINNGEIILGKNSKLIALGKITGEGEIINSSSSVIYEPFKNTDSRGGGMFSAIVNSFTSIQKSCIFPFWDYFIDNIKCKTLFVGGSKYKLMGSTYGMHISICLIGNSNDYQKAIFILNQTSRIEKSAPSSKITMNFIQGTINDSFVTLNVAGMAELPTNVFTFPLVNMDIIIQENAKVNLSSCNDATVKFISNVVPLSNQSTSYLMLPTSRLINYGTLNIGAKNRFGFISRQDASYIAGDYGYYYESDETYTTSFVLKDKFETAMWKSFSGNSTFLSNFLNYGVVNSPEYTESYDGNGEVVSENNIGGIYKMVQTNDGHYYEGSGEFNEENGLEYSNSRSDINPIWSTNIFDLDIEDRYRTLYFEKYM